MTSARAELVLGPLRSLRRSALVWAIGLGSLIVATVAFWPVFRDSSGITEAIEQLPPGVIDAFGLAGFGTPAGFLRGNLYELIVPLLLSVAAVAATNGLTAAEEDAGRLELFVSQPVSRRAVFVGRVFAMFAWLAILTGLILATQLVSDVVFGLDIAAGQVVSTVILCGLLALIYAMVAAAVAGWYPRPAAVLAIGVAAAVAGYLMAALFPLSDTLEPLSRLSPWDWAFAGDPLTTSTEPWRYVALSVPALALGILAVAGFLRRDIRAA